VRAWNMARRRVQRFALAAQTLTGPRIERHGIAMATSSTVAIRSSNAGSQSLGSGSVMPAGIG